MQKYILFAEDDPSSQRFVEKVLLREGYRCDLVSNGQAAVIKYKEKNYDLVIMNGKMPIMDGFEATGKIRAYESEVKKRAVPIIAYTAFLGDNHARWYKCGVNTVLEKGSLADLLLKVEYCLEG